jgi:hypothetical protein
MGGWGDTSHALCNTSCGARLQSPCQILESVDNLPAFGIRRQVTSCDQNRSIPTVYQQQHMLSDAQLSIPRTILSAPSLQRTGYRESESLTFWL